MNYFLADCIAVATAKSYDAVIVTKDPEIIPVEKDESLPVLWIK